MNGEFTLNGFIVYHIFEYQFFMLPPSRGMLSRVMLLGCHGGPTIVVLFKFSQKMAPMQDYLGFNEKEKDVVFGPSYWPSDLIFRHFS